jgi:hypothetical protein
MNKSESIAELAKALNAFQGKMKAVKKDAVNPFFKSHYATLDAIWETIREPLLSNGLSLTQTLGQSSDGKTLLDTTLLHISGEWIAGSMLINPVKDDPQGLGSAISYARRYSLCAMLGVVADEDDDANIATKPKPITKAQIKGKPEEETTSEPKIGVSVESTTGTITTEELYQFIAKNMKWKTPTAARSFIINKCKIEEARIDNETDAVYNEIKQLQNW